MGYTTDFTGSLKLSRPATEEEKNYINLFTNTRRMKRDINKLMSIYQGKNGYPFTIDNTPEAIYGVEGEYFASEDGQYGQAHDESIIDYNMPPGQMLYGSNDFDKVWRENEHRILNGTCQPGLWCKWCITDDGTELEWNGAEKFYYYTEWLNYLINHFFERWGIKLNGIIEWKGEDDDDTGTIIVTDNIVKTSSMI